MASRQGPSRTTIPVRGITTRADLAEMMAAAERLREMHRASPFPLGHPEHPFAPQPELAALEGRTRGWLKHHRHPARALGYIAAADLLALAASAHGIHVDAGWTNHVGRSEHWPINWDFGPWPEILTGVTMAVEACRVAVREGLFHHHDQDETPRPGLRRVRWYAFGSWAIATLGLLAAARIGAASPWAQAGILLGGLAVAAPYLRKHRSRWKIRGPLVHLPPPAAPEPTADPWAQRVDFQALYCGKGGAIAGAQMEEPRALPNGWQAEIQLVPGKQSTADVIGLQDSMASLFRVPLDQIVPEHVSSRQRDRALLTVVTRAQEFHTAKLWKGSTYDPATGCIRIGWFADSAPTLHRLHTPGSGGWHAMVTGTTGGGKSAVMSLILTECVNALNAAGQRIMSNPWILDPQAQSLPMWTDHADLVALGPVSCILALRALHAALKARSAHMGQQSRTLADGRTVRGIGTFDPTPDSPLWPVIIDEAHVLLQHEEYATEAAWLISQISKLARKVGAMLLLASQLSQVSEIKDKAIRAMLAGMGAICLRSGEKQTANMIGVEGNPFILPVDCPGQAFVKGPDRRSGAVSQLDWVGPEARELDGIEAGGFHGLDLITVNGITRAAANPVRVKGTPKGTLYPFDYQPGGTVLRDAA